MGLNITTLKSLVEMAAGIIYLCTKALLLIMS